MPVLAADTPSIDPQLIQAVFVIIIMLLAGLAKWAERRMQQRKEVERREQGGAYEQSPPPQSPQPQPGSRRRRLGEVGLPAGVGRAEPQRPASRKAAPVAPAVPEPPAVEPLSAVAAALPDEHGEPMVHLRDPEQVRRAILYHEILSPPMGLRRRAALWDEA